MGKPHRNAEVLHAIADGKAVQFKEGSDWVDFYNSYYSPIESPELQWRIKPEPKPDVVRFLGTGLPLIGFSSYISDDINLISHYTDKVKLIFDGETGKLKSAEVLS